MAVLIALIVVLGAAGPQDGLIAAPDDTAQKQSEKLIKDLFKEDYAKKAPKDLMALAEKLVEQGRQLKDDRPTQYVLFREAQDIFAQAGDADSSLKTIDEWASIFALDAFSMKAKALGVAAKVARTPEENRALATAYLKFADAAAAADQYEVADKSSQSALSAARKANNLGLANKAASRSKGIAALKTRFEKVQKAKDTLKTSPDDPAANALLGQFECLGKGNWDAGLLPLSKGTPGALASAAKKDLEAPADAPSQSAVGDSWWDLAEKDQPPAKAFLRSRAVFWYEMAAQKLSGLGKTKVEKRLAEYRMDRVHQGNWTDISDPKLYGRTTAAGAPMEIGRQESLKIAKAPQGDFDGYSVKVKLLSDDAIPNIQHEPRKVMVVLDAVRKNWSVSTYEDTAWVPGDAKPLTDGSEWTLTFLLEGEEQLIFLDGVEIHRRLTTTEKLPLPILVMHSGRAAFSQMKFRKRE